MDDLSTYALAAALAWGSGLRLYAVVVVAGLAGRFGWMTLPGELDVLGHDAVLWTAGALALIEFTADKIPAVDSLWDAVHTAIRIPAGAALAWGALGDQGPAIQLAAGLLAGTITTGTHFAKAGARVAINHSPEPFSNGLASFTEDSLVLAGLWLAIVHPWAFLAALLVFLALVAWLLPKLFRLLRAGWRRLRGRDAPPIAGGPAVR